MRARIVDSEAAGTILVNEAMLHHVFFNNLGRKRVAGQLHGAQPEVFYGTGEENEVTATSRPATATGSSAATTGRWAR